MATSPFFRRLHHSDTELNDWIERLKRLREPVIAAARAHPAHEIVEHIPAPPVVVSRERHRVLTERAWIGPTQTNTVTGDVSHLRRVRQADGRYVTERVDGPAPAATDATAIANTIPSSTAGCGPSCESAGAAPSSGQAIPPDSAPAVETDD